MREIRRDPAYIEDPEVTEYIRAVGRRLIAATPGSQLIRLENGNLIDPTGALRNPPAATVVA